MDILLTIAACVAAGFYVLAPLALWLSGARIPTIQWDELQQSDAVPNAAEAHFWKTTTFLAAQGFDRAGARVRESMPNGLSNYTQLWRSHETAETAFVATTLKGDGAEYSNSFVVFLHERENGGLIATSNFVSPARANLDPPGMSKLTAPGESLENLRHLHKAHCALLAERLRPIRMRDALTFCQALDAATRTTALATKRYRAAGDALRITLWGAFYGIWINLPPLKSVYARRDLEWLQRVRAVDESAFTREHRAA